MVGRTDRGWLERQIEVGWRERGEREREREGLSHCEDSSFRDVHNTTGRPTQDNRTLGHGAISTSVVRHAILDT